jgi:hypothetical protein
MIPQPLLDFLYTLPTFITNAPPVIGVSEQAQVKVVLQLNRQLKNIFIEPRLLQTPLNLRSHILEAITDVQQFRDRQVQLIISRNACVAKLSLWDVEGTLLAIKTHQAAVSINYRCCTRNSLVSVGRGQHGDIDSPPETLRERLVLNSLGVGDSRELEMAIIDAAHQGHQKVRELQEAWPFSELRVL